MADALQNAAATGTYERISVQPIAGALGAEISGVDLSRLDDATFGEIHRAFLEYQAIFFRDQDLTPEQYLAFARRWGEIHFYPYMKGLEGFPEIFGPDVRSRPGQGDDAVCEGATARGRRYAVLQPVSGL
jgi:alpha-ketoglutarate-dependent taurine dioxygenase